MESYGRIVENVLDAWARKSLDALLAHFSEDAVCHPMPFPPLVGKKAIGEGLQQVFDSSEFEKFLIVNQLQSGNLLMNERVDHLVVNGKKVELSVVGIFEFRDGKITHWRDYFDGGALTPR